jgi:hypothetical protein
MDPFNRSRVVIGAAIIAGECKFNQPIGVKIVIGFTHIYKREVQTPEIRFSAKENIIPTKG